MKTRLMKSEVRRLMRVSFGLDLTDAGCGGTVGQGPSEARPRIGDPHGRRRRPQSEIPRLGGGMAHPGGVGRPLSAGRPPRLGRHDLHPHFGARSGGGASFPDQSLRLLFRRDHRLIPGEGRSGRQHRSGHHRLHQSGGLHHPFRSPCGAGRRKVRDPSPYGERGRGGGSARRFVADQPERLFTTASGCVSWLRGVGPEP